MSELETKSIKELWSNILKLLDSDFEGYSNFLNPPATLDEINSIEQQMGAALPKELQELYLCNNGDSKKLEGSIMGLRFLPLNELYQQWNTWQEIINEEDAEGMKQLSVFCKSNPKGVIRKLYANSKWIPFSHDYSGNHIGIDLDPEVKGVSGQIINFGRDEDEKYVIARNLQEFLILMLQLLEKKAHTIKTINESICLTLEDDIHPIDMFKETVKG